MTFSPQSPAEMKKLAEAVSTAICQGAPHQYDVADRALSRACSPSQIIHDADLIEAQAKRIEELLPFANYVGCLAAGDFGDRGDVIKAARALLPPTGEGAKT